MVAISLLLASCAEQTLVEDPCINRVDPERCRQAVDVCRRSFYCDLTRVDLGEPFTCPKQMTCATAQSLCLLSFLCTDMHGRPIKDASCGASCRRYHDICRVRCEKPTP
jgi:hypothetical protein